MQDHELITSLGGPRKVADLLGFGKYGQQRVTNWMTRGIPAAIKVRFPEIFLKEVLLKKPRKTSVDR